MNGLTVLIGMVIFRLSDLLEQNVVQSSHSYRILRKCLYGSALLDIERAVPADLRIAGFGVRQQSHRQCDGNRRRHQNHPEGGLFVVQHGPDPLLHAHLAKGQWTGGDLPGVDAARKQGGGVGLLFFRTEIPDHFLVTGHLDIPAQQNICHPHQGIEPVNGQEQKAQRLPPVIPAGEVGPFMGDHMLPRLLTQGAGQTDHGPEESENERGVDVVAEEDVPLSPHPLPQPPPDPDAADQCPKAHNQRAQEPHIGKHRQPHLQRVDTGPRRGPQGLGVDGVHRLVDGIKAALDLGRGVIQALGRDDLPAGHQTEAGLQNSGNEKPHRHQGPQGADHPPGSLLQRKPRQDHRQHHKACRIAGVQDVKKQLGHGHTSSKVSIIRRISSISARDRLRRRVKAARNPGRLPEKVSSTNRSDCMA